jgi:hypothetical protein
VKVCYFSRADLQSSPFTWKIGCSLPDQDAEIQDLSAVRLDEKQVNKAAMITPSAVQAAGEREIVLDRSDGKDFPFECSDIPNLPEAMMSD